MENIHKQELFTSSNRNRFLEAFGLDEYDIQDVSIHGAPIKEAYAETMEALTYSKTEEAKQEGYIPVRSSAIWDTGRLLAGVLSRISIVPIVMPLPGGGLGLQWNGQNDRIFTASLYGDNQVTFCSIFSDTRRVTGICEVGLLPSSFIPELEDILGVDLFNA